MKILSVWIISFSFSCRISKGTHKAIDRFRSFTHKVSQNNTKTCWILKCDIKKFFASIDQDILMSILRKYITDEDILWLLGMVISSFSSTNQDKGLPLGNLTSQLFANIYLNEFDQFVKHRLKAKYYIRYADDFVLLSEDKNRLAEQIPHINNFLQKNLKLILNPQKVLIKTLASGVDFLGWVHWVHYPNHRILRTATKRRVIKRIKERPVLETFNSYLGLLKHGNTSKLKRRLIKEYISNQDRV